MELLLDNHAYQNLYQHARKIFPNECCGFLYGTEHENRVIFQTLEINNVMQGDQRDKFEIGPKDYQYGEEYARRNNVDLLGIYHSHPDHPAYPSEFDLRRAFPYFSYIIISVDSEKMLDIRSWQLSEDQSFEEEVIRFAKVVQ